MEGEGPPSAHTGFLLLGCEIDNFLSSFLPSPFLHSSGDKAVLKNGPHFGHQFHSGAGSIPSPLEKCSLSHTHTLFLPSFQISQEWTFGSGLCEMWTMSDVLCCTASILHLLAIAIDR